MTAAHCLYGVQTGVLDMVDILLGEYSMGAARTGLKRKIQAVTIHPKVGRLLVVD